MSIPLKPILAARPVLQFYNTLEPGTLLRITSAAESQAFITITRAEDGSFAIRSNLTGSTSKIDAGRYDLLRNYIVDTTLMYSKGTISFIAAPSPSGIPPETLTAPYNFGGECGFAMIWLLLAIAVVTAVLYLSYNRV